MSRLLLTPLLLAILGATACGQKGPLLLPDAKTGAPVAKPPAAPATAQPATAAPDAKKEKSRPN